MTVCCPLSESLNASGLIAWVVEMSSQEDTRWLNRSQPNGIPTISFWSRCPGPVPSSTNCCYHVRRGIGGQCKRLVLTFKCLCPVWTETVAHTPVVSCVCSCSRGWVWSCVGVQRRAAASGWVQGPQPLAPRPQPPAPGLSQALTTLVSHRISTHSPGGSAGEQIPDQVSESLKKSNMC